jgi:NAD(P)-dependent dehydrogenase (short-subunit alcohol dehydrogenase family)
MRMLGKSVLVTGAAHGMGACEATTLAREGARVVVADVSDGAEQVAGDIRRSGGEAIAVSLDVTSDLGWRKAVDKAVEAFGAIHVLVNNAGIAAPYNDTRLSEEDWSRVLDVNAKGVFLGLKHALPAIERSGGGAVVNISSIAAKVGLDKVHLAYSASKGAVLSMTRLAAVDWAPRGIRINAVVPGFMPRMQSSTAPASGGGQSHAIPLGRNGRAEDVANAVLFLASEEASYVTGTELVVDGGYLAT